MERRQAAYAWASSAGFSKTGMGAPKVMADLVESLAGAVFLDTDRYSMLSSWPDFRTDGGHQGS